MRGNLHGNYAALRRGSVGLKKTRRPRPPR